MRDDVNTRLGEEEAVVVRLASRVVAMLASRSDEATESVDVALALALQNAALSADPQAMAAALAEFRRQRVTPAVLADLYIPHVARTLGQSWLDDCLAFSEVSIGSTRLQGILHSIDAEWIADKAQGSEVGTILLLVPECEQHTLGPMVLLGQLRRRGVSVCLRFGPSRVELARLLRSYGFNGVLISVASVESLAASRQIIDRIRANGGETLPVVIGGAVLDKGLDVMDMTGADALTTDVDVALRACGLTSDIRKPRRSA